LENKYEAVGWVWWYVAIIPATQVEVGLSWFEAGLGRVSLRPYLENKVKAKRLETWLNGRESACQVLRHSA
jgi:hypothetical protein